MKRAPVTTPWGDAREVFPADRGFPPALSEAQPPVERLWVLGQELGPERPRIAIVGSRGATPYGCEVAFELARDLAGAGVTVVSGMARGIDAAAHHGALDGGGSTVAVLACGIDRVYPAANALLHREIVKHGTVCTERPPGSIPYRACFPVRNRIIVALSAAVVLVQSEGARSGAFGTARLANDFGVELLAVPGEVRSELSAGPHIALREGWARICVSADDVLEAIGLGPLPAGSDAAAAPSSRADPDEAALERALRAEPGAAEALAARAGIELLPAMRALSRLELAGRVTRGLSGAYRLRR